MADLAAALEEARRGLLDLSTRNRLLSLPAPGRARGVLRLDDEDADFVLARLAEGKAFGFEATAGEDPARDDTADDAPTAVARAAPETTAHPAPATDAPPARPPRAQPAAAAATKTAARPAPRRRAAPKADGITIATAATREARRADDRLGIHLTPTELARKLRDIIADARTAREESGVPTLFLALGALAWRDPATPETERLAPLALIPASIEREGVSNLFRLRAVPEEVAENLSLREKLGGMGIALPAFDADAYDPAKWAEAVAAVTTRADWRVEPDSMAVGLFSFAKFLMWRDLGPEANPGLAEHPLVRSLVGGEALPPQPQAFADDCDVDEAIPVEKLDHVVDVDGSQALATELARRGGHVVIQGPPGTGKSQSICNILAQAVLDGRSVLFVAEKLAALEVVQRRLTNLGLGAACLELHSEKQSKRAVLDELRATLAIPAPPAPARDAVVQRLGEMRGRLNRHAAAMRGPAGASGLPLHAVIGSLVALRQRGVPAPDFTLPAPDAAQLQAWRDAVRELAARAAEGGPASVWRGVTTALDATAAERMLARLPGWIRAFAAAPGGPAEAESGWARAQAVAAALGEPAPDDAGYQGGAARLAALRADLALLATADPRLRDWRRPGLAEARATLAEPGGLFGFLSGPRRAAQALVAEIAATPDADPLPVLDAAIARQQAAGRLDAAEAWAKPAYGTGWRAAQAVAPAMPMARLRPALDAWQELGASLAPDIAEAFGAAPGFAAIAERLTLWASDPDALQPWMAWHRARAALPELAPLAAQLATGSLLPEAAADAADYAALEALLRGAMHDQPALAAFDGGAMDRVVEDFRAADAARVALTRAEAASAHASRMRAVRDSPGVTLLKGEMEKRRGHLPVRELLLRVGSTVQAIKPIFMMSPLSVAQFLSPPHGLKPGLTFDLMVMDEASQIEPVDALGAIARCRQIVVVGDDKQMPPTRFFQRMTSDDDEAPEDAADTVAAREVESILGLANARGVPSAMLRWHYRSRHESLIATSNQEFYGNRLLVLPSPKPRSAMLGLSLVRVDGRFDTGASGTNVIEAAAVAAAVMRHARETPGDTLGVAAFSVKQRDAIIDAVEKLRRDSPGTEPFFTANPAEPFFVKNLENVQGDERDAIMISVGYGRDRDGRLSMRFGPLSAEGGERRLNVLITRAKLRCIVFSGIGAEEIDLARAGGRGVAALKTFLGFAAQTGGLRPLGGAGDSPLASAIARVVQEAGKNPVRHVGLSGLFLDVAAAGAAGYELGVETDGADWAALRCARDRDRGRQGALAGMGWKLTRSWSLDWLNRPAAAQARLRQALGAAPLAEAPAAAPAETGLAIPYVEADVAALRDRAILATPGRLSEALAEIVRIEAPVHLQAVVERARILLGAETLAAADRAILVQAAELARRLHGLLAEGDFWRAGDSPPPVPRDRRAAAPFLRRPAMLPPAEIELAALALQAAAPAVTEAELAAGLARMLGLEASGAIALEARVAALVGAGKLSLPGGGRP